MRIRPLLLALVATSICSTTRADKPRSWWNAGWRYRTTVQRSTPCMNSTARPIESAVDFPLLLKEAGIEEPFDPATVRIIARDANGEARETPFSWRVEYDARRQRHQRYLAWITKPRGGQRPIFEFYFDTMGRGIEPAEYAVTDLPPDNLIDNPSFEVLTGGVPDGWRLTPVALVRPGPFAATSGLRSLAVVVDDKTPARTPREAVVSQRVDVRRFAGQEMLFECDMMAECATYGAPVCIELEQYREDGTRLPQFAVQPRWLTLELAQGQLVQFSERGCFHPQAATLNIRIRVRCYVRDADTRQQLTGPESHFTVWLDRVVVRPGERWVWPARSCAGFVEGALTDAPENRAFKFTGRRRVAFNGASEGSLTDGKYNPDPKSAHWGLQAGTLEFWCRPGWDVHDGGEHVFFEGVAYGHRLQSRMRKLPTDEGGQLEFAIGDSAETLRRVRGPAMLEPGQWRHVAATWDFPNAHLQLFVDGKRVAEEGPHQTAWPSAATPGDNRVKPGMGILKDDRRSLPMQAFIGGDRGCRKALSAEAVLDELRISDVVRYHGRFAPPREQCAVDDHTRALFHFENSASGVHALDDQFVEGRLACELHPLLETAPLDVLVERRIHEHAVVVAPHAGQPLFQRNRAEKQFIVTRPLQRPPDPRYVVYRERRVERTVRDLSDEFEIQVGGDHPPLMRSITFEHAEGASGETTLLPRWRANDNVVPFSFQELARTLAPRANTDRERAFAVFRYALATTNYYDAGICETLPTRHRPRVAYTLGKALNIYAFDQCGPLNYTLRKMFLAAGISSNDASGTHHQFEQAFYDGDYRLFDLSPRMFWLTRDNQNVASRRHFEEDLYLKLRHDCGVTSGIPGRVARARFGAAERPHRFDFHLRAGERVSVAWHNEGRWVELTRDRRPIPLGRIPPTFGNGAVEFRPRKKSEAATQDNVICEEGSGGSALLRMEEESKDASLLYRVACPYVFSGGLLSGIYRSGKTGALAVSLSFDRGKSWLETWRSPSKSGELRVEFHHAVMGRYEYWLKLQLAAGSDAAVNDLAVRSTFVVSPLALPGTLSLGTNRIRFVGGPLTTSVKTTCRWVERHQTQWAASLDSLRYYMDGDRTLRNLYVARPGQELRLKIRLSGRRYVDGEAALDEAPRGWITRRSRATFRPGERPDEAVAELAVRPDVRSVDGDVAGLSVVLRSGGVERRIPVQILLAETVLTREAEAADQKTGNVKLIERPELSGAAGVDFDGDGRLAFDTDVGQEGVYALWLRARWKPQSSTGMTLQIDEVRPRSFSAMAMIGFTDWTDPRRAHTKMFAHFGEQYGHWSWYRLPDVQLSAGRHRLTVAAGDGASLDALLLLPQNARVDRAAMNLLQNWNYAPWDNPL